MVAMVLLCLCYFLPYSVLLVVMVMTTMTVMMAKEEQTIHVLVGRDGDDGDGGVGVGCDARLPPSKLGPDDSLFPPTHVKI